MSTKTIIKSGLIAPCGMNCALCMARLIREKNQCPGCRGDELGKPKHCVQCVIVNCDHFKETKNKYCSSKCAKFPCTRLRNLDKRYRTKYHMSMLENLKYIFQAVGYRLSTSQTWWLPPYERSRPRWPWHTYRKTCSSRLEHATRPKPNMPTLLNLWFHKW